MLVPSIVGALAFLLATAGWAARRRGSAAVWFGLGLCVFAWSGPVAAAEFRSGDQVRVAADEVVGSTMFVSGSVVEIDGRVDGDLFVAGERVVIRGTVEGNVTAASAKLELVGAVAGTLHWAGRSLRLGGSVADNAYLAGESLTLISGGEVQGDLFAAAERWRQEGTVGRDLTVAAKKMTLVGSVGRDVKVNLSTGEIADQSRIGGDLVAFTEAADGLRVGEGTEIGGERRVDVYQPSEHPGEDYTGVGYFVWQLVRVVASFFVGLLLFVVAPRLFVRTIEPSRWFRLAGTGLVLLVVPPVAGVVLLLTVIGIPLGVIVFGAYALAVYLAQIVVAGVVALRVLKRAPTRTGEFAPVLALGVVALAILRAIPFLGGLVGFAALLVGLGLLYSTTATAVRARSTT
ncbi:MAG: polymer-forming cytoskeletal protein [Myxococcales bacterium FL481]|nr:MAG: polymer-forming cytoskeletal protein [Myxococcales bacterium FL481]